MWIYAICDDKHTPNASHTENSKVITISIPLNIY